MSYYEDPDKLTFIGAEMATLDYIREQDDQTYTTNKQVAQSADIEQSHHNLLRLDDALSRLCEVHRDPESRPTRYQL